MSPMGSYAELKIEDLEIAHFKSEVESWVSLVFTADDWRSRQANPEELVDHGVDGPLEIQELVAAVPVVRDRLDLTGADWATASLVFDDLVREKREWLLEFRDRMDDMRERLDVELTYLSNFALHDWVSALRNAAPDSAGTSRLDVGTRRWLIDLWSGGDVRLCLRAALECRPDGDVVLDATDLISGGWLSADADPRQSALLQFGWAERYASPVVVLTEGRSDARVLETALAVTHPHLRGFIRFPDFSHQQESNAGALVKTVKAFAAAGISNRVVALFDADTAARDAVRSLAPEKLPPSIKVRHLPRIELAARYPTLGPDGSALADVNGRACSIELYLGRDVLTDDRGDLHPIRWTAFMSGVDAWHGVVDRKAEVLDRFWAKAEAAVNDPSVVPSQDWADLRAVIDQVRTAAAES